MKKKRSSERGAFMLSGHKRKEFPLSSSFLRLLTLFSFNQKETYQGKPGDTRFGFEGIQTARVFDSSQRPGVTTLDLNVAG